MFTRQILLNQARAITAQFIIDCHQYFTLQTSVFKDECKLVQFNALETMFLSVPSTRKLKKSQLMGQLGNQKFVKIDQKEPESLFASLWKFFAKNTSVHGVHYLAEPSTNIFEKLLWSVGIISATAAMIHSCTMLSGRFSASLLSTVFESTSFKVSEIPFAAVTLCNNNRLDYNKTNAAIATLFPNRSQSETETFVKFVHALQNMEWGSFDELIVVSEDDTTEMDKLNISQVYEFMMHDCEAFFVSCSWRKVPFNCCDHFSKQLSEYGICWSFNSYSNAGTEHVNVSFFIKFQTISWVLSNDNL